MIKISNLLFEGEATPGVAEAWLDPDGNGYIVRDNHASWASNYIKTNMPDIDYNIPNFKSDIAGYERQKIKLMRVLYDKGWVRVMLHPSQNYLYFDTFDINWKDLTSKQRRWLYDIATHEWTLSGDKMIPLINNPRHVALTVRFGNVGREIDINRL